MTDRLPHTPSHPGGDAALARLVARLDEQKLLLGELRRLGLSQRALVERSDAVGLLALLAERQGLIERLARAAEAGRREHEAWGATRPSGEGRRDIQRRIDELGLLHDEIGRNDQHDQASMQRSHGQMAMELSGLSHGRRALNAYAPEGAERARYQDTKG
ncbi:hypothetical protein PHYC_02774 [Phycisphaerales bacterium]|nr:hypothetical protein PHYC_02774 [Phycisphaerales bacterium]